MSEQLLITLQSALQELAIQETQENLGDRSTYLGASDIGSCPRKTILGKVHPPEIDLVTLLRFRRGHMAEDIVAAAFVTAGFTSFQRQVEASHNGEVPIIAHLDFVFISEARKTMAVLEVKSPEKMPDEPHGAWESQLYLQMGLLAESFPEYTVEKGAILAVNLGEYGMQLFNGYTPQETMYAGLLDRAKAIWDEYQQYQQDNNFIPRMEAGPLCGFCKFIADCPKFAADEVQELRESVEILTTLQKQQKELEKDISTRKRNLLAIVDQRGPMRANGHLLRKASRSRNVLDTVKLTEFLSDYDQSIANFQTTSSYSFLEIKQVA